MRTLQFWAFFLAALASMSLGLEVERLQAAGAGSLASSDSIDPSESSATASLVRAGSKAVPDAPGARNPAPRSLGSPRSLASDGAGADGDATSAAAAPPGVGAAAGIDWGQWARALPMAFPPSWQPLSTRELWSMMSPGSRAWFESAGRAQIHETVWVSGVLPVLASPPAIWLAALSVLVFLAARMRAGQQVPTPAGVRSFVRFGALVLAGIGFATLGADLFRAGGEWETRSLLELWSSLHPQSLLEWGQATWLSNLLDWPAWLGLAGVGGGLAYLTRPRPDLVMYAVPQAAVGPARFVDVSRTLAYLDSLRSWPPRGRRRRDAIPDRELADPRHFD